MVSRHIYQKNPSSKREISENRYSICCSTQNIFNGWFLRDIWEKENSSWLEFTTSVVNNSYRFPSLGNSPYADEFSRRLHKPAICQKIHWSSDGTSFVTIHDDYGLRQYLMPEKGSKNDKLIPFTRFFKNQSIVTSAVHPKYSLFNEESSNNVTLVGLRDIPLQLLPLRSDNVDGKALQSYDVVDPNNEEYYVPYSLSFIDETRFLAGFKRNKVLVYDVSRSQPIQSTQSTKQQCGKFINKTIVSCFDENSSRYLFERHRIFGTYKNELYRFDIRTSGTQLLYRSRLGNGITQVLKSSNGNFVYLIKRNSDKIDVLDTRQSFKKVNELQLPFKITNQKLNACISEVNGLSIGTYRGTVVNWSKDLVEFGGISRELNSQEGSIVHEAEITLPLNSAAINILEPCPTDDYQYAISYAPDKFLGPTGNELSGILIAQNFLE